MMHFLKLPNGSLVVPVPFETNGIVGERMVEITPEETMTVALRNEGQLTRPVPWKAGDAVAVGWLPEDCQLLEDA